MANKRISDFQTLSSAQDADLILIDSNGTTYNISFATLKRDSKGAKGDTGATPNLTIGTVSTLNPGQSATASITGTAENPVLNLGIPKGDQGYTLTEADKQEIVARVIAALPSAVGVSF